jgi:hypothetical protein
MYLLKYTRALVKSQKIDFQSYFSFKYGPNLCESDLRLDVSQRNIYNKILIQYLYFIQVKLGSSKNTCDWPGKFQQIHETCNMSGANHVILLEKQLI